MHFKCDGQALVEKSHIFTEIQDLRYQELFYFRANKLLNLKQAFQLNIKVKTSLRNRCEIEYEMFIIFDL